MKKLFVRSLVCLHCLAALATAADVSVRAVDTHHAPIATATISLISRNSGENRNLTTDVSGTCRFQAIAAGEYLIQGEASGFDPSKPQLIDLKKDDRSEVELLMARRSSVRDVHFEGNKRSPCFRNRLSTRRHL